MSTAEQTEGCCLCDDTLQLAIEQDTGVCNDCVESGDEDLEWPLVWDAGGYTVSRTVFGPDEQMHVGVIELDERKSADYAVKIGDGIGESIELLTERQYRALIEGLQRALPETETDDLEVA